jgi:hypothetical protein
MYCPICFNDTLKIASGGVVKLSFNGKSKATSQFYYNFNEETRPQRLVKLDDAIDDYFKYYSSFQNQDIIRNVEALSIDFKCSNRCVLGINNRVNVLGLVIDKEELRASLEKAATKHGIQLKLEGL